MTHFFQKEAANLTVESHVRSKLNGQTVKDSGQSNLRTNRYSRLIYIYLVFSV